MVGWRRWVGLSIIAAAASAGAQDVRLLAPGVISTEAHNEFGLALTPDGDTAYFTRDGEIFTSSRIAGEWNEAQPVAFGSEAFDGDPFISTDGERLYFMSSRAGSVVADAGAGVEPLADVWVCDRQPDGSWGEPRNLGPAVNTAAVEGHASVTANGSVYYFSKRDGGLGGHDIYRSLPGTVGLGEAQNLGAPINTEEGDGHPYVSADESYLVFYSNRPGGYGSCDLYISFLDGESWSTPRNLGPEINTADCDMTPHVSPDGTKLYFARIDEQGARDIYVADFRAESWRRDVSDLQALRFEEGMISRGNEFALAFAPDGETAYFTRRSARGDEVSFDIMRTDLVAGCWTMPVPVSFNSDQRDADPFVSPDGARLFFMSTRPVGDGTRPNEVYDLWQVTRPENGAWGEPQHLGFDVNSETAWEGFPTVTEHGTFFTPKSVLFFFSERPGGLGRSDIYRSVMEDGTYGLPSNLGPPINSPHWDGLPYVSPDETFLIFSSDRPGGHGGQDLYVSYSRNDRSWTEPENLGPRVNTAESELFPHLGPDGQHLFFSRFHDDGERHIYSIPTRHTGVRLDASGHYDLKHSNPDWAPDGTHIAFDSNRAGNYDVFITDREGAALDNVTRHPSKDRHPAWSPDGEWIAFDSDRLGSADIWLVRPDGSDLYQLTDDAADETRPVWSPDGQRLVYSSNRSGDWEIYVTERDGSSAVNISRHPAFDMAYSWSPDGDRVAFESERNQNGSRDIFSMRPDGSDVEALTDDPNTDRWPAWSPDGERIAFCSDRGNTDSWDLYVMGRDGDRVLGVFASTGIDWAPKWSPDGDSLVFASRHGSERHLYTVSLQHFRLKQLTRGLEQAVVTKQ